MTADAVHGAPTPGGSAHFRQRREREGRRAVQDGVPSVAPPGDDDVLTVEELVAWLRLSESTVLKLLSERAIPARKVGHQWRIRRGRVRDWLDGRE